MGDNDTIDDDSISIIDAAFDRQRSAFLAGHALRRCREDYVRLIFGRRFGRAVAADDAQEVMFLALTFQHWGDGKLSLWTESEMLQWRVMHEGTAKPPRRRWFRRW